MQDRLGLNLPAIIVPDPSPDVYRGGDSFELPRLTRAIAVDEVYD